MNKQVKLKLLTDPRFEEKFKSYPKAIRPKLAKLRKLIEASANELEGVTALEETLKWGEPSFVAKKGSTIRIDWKEKAPDQYAMYFKCTSRLVETFRNVYGDFFRYEKNRAILFELDQKVPEKELKNCIKCALQYHSVKSLPDLGISSV